jgi:excisionase family DNA binding protein
MADDDLLTVQDLANWIKVPVDTIYGWRSRGQGPKGIKMGRHVRYLRSEVYRWLTTRVDGGTPWASSC